MKIAVIGKSGQLAWELSQLIRVDVEVICLGREQIDITDKNNIAAVLSGVSANAVINASAYTAVDKAETDVDNAERINTTAIGLLADVCSEMNLHLVHVSTDFVFGGDKGSPYLPSDEVNPIGVYGATKAAGEALLVSKLPLQSCIIRTSWVYSVHGNNFVKTMLNLMASKPELGIISDQIGTPTNAQGLAKACVYAAVNSVAGVHHYTDAGVASWYDFAVAIQELAIAKKLLKTAIEIKPILTKDYPTPAKRPSYSVLDKSSLAESFSGIGLIHWRTQLSSMLDALKLDIRS